MKKLFFTLIVSVLFVITAKAQVSMDMETWVQAGTSAYKNPQGWTSFNQNTSGLNVVSQTVYKDTTVGDFYQGLASAKIVTSRLGSPFATQVPNPFRPGHTYDTMGIMALGTYASGVFKFGRPIAMRQAALSFASKYTPVSGDSAYVIAYLTKWNVNHRDTIARGIYRTGATTTSYSVNTITMTYGPAFAGVVPDTQMIYCSSSRYKTVGSKVGSAFYVDEFQWVGFTGIDDFNGETAHISCFPNPATSEINFTSSVNANFVEVADITGRKVGLFVMQNNKVKIQTESFTPGLYLFTVMNDKKVVINRGKFEISK